MAYLIRRGLAERAWHGKETAGERRREKQTTEGGKLEQQCRGERTKTQRKDQWLHENRRERRGKPIMIPRLEWDTEESYPEVERWSNLLSQNIESPEGDNDFK